MDQGIAALIAGLTGMVGAVGGAVAGAVGAVRGAKVGAEKTASATRQQVQDQAIVEHGHWVRQERKAAYSAFISANQSVERTAKVAMDRVPVPQPEARAAVEALREAIEEMNDIASQISVLGPDGMIAAVSKIFYFAFRLRDELGTAIYASSHTQDDVSRADELWDELVTAGSEFQAKARDVIVEHTP